MIKSKSEEIFSMSSRFFSIFTQHPSNAMLLLSGLSKFTESKWPEYCGLIYLRVKIMTWWLVPPVYWYIVPYPVSALAGLRVSHQLLPDLCTAESVWDPPGLCQPCTHMISSSWCGEWGVSLQDRDNLRHHSHVISTTHPAQENVLWEIRMTSGIFHHPLRYN